MLSGFQGQMNPFEILQITAHSFHLLIFSMPRLALDDRSAILAQRTLQRQQMRISACGDHSSIPIDDDYSAVAFYTNICQISFSE